MRDEWRLKAGWRVKPKLEGDKDWALYVSRMAQAKRLEHKDIYSRPKPVKPEGMSQSDWILSMQAASTREIIEKQKDPDYKRDWTTPLPDNVLANPEANTVDEFVGRREYDEDAWSHIEAIRRRPKNSIGQSNLRGVPDSMIESAKHHFMVSPPALLTDEEIEGLTKLTDPVQGIPADAPPTSYRWEKMSFFRAIWHWFTGGEVKSIKADEFLEKRPLE